MPFVWRKSKKLGPFRLTASKRGMGESVGIGRARVTRSPNGRGRVTFRLPFGVRYQKMFGTSRRRSRGL